MQEDSVLLGEIRNIDKLFKSRDMKMGKNNRENTLQMNESQYRISMHVCMKWIMNLRREKRRVRRYLNDEGSAGHDAGSTGKEVATNNVLKNTAFAARLASNHTDLREAEGLVAEDGERILCCSAS